MVIDPVQFSLSAWHYDQDNRVRLQNYKIMESYYDGTFDLDQKSQVFDGLRKNHIVSPRIAEALESEFRVICNYAKTVCNKAVGYLCADPVSIEVKPDLIGLENDDTDLTEEQKAVNKKERKARNTVAKNAEKILYDVYKKNSFLHKHIIKLIRLQAKKGECFVKVWVDSSRKIRLTLLKPDIVFPKFGTEEDYEAFEHVAIIYDRPDGNGGTEKYAQVWWPDKWREYISSAKTLSWKQIGEDHRNDIGIIPIIHIKNTHDEKPWGESDIECIVTLIDAMCKAFTDLMVNADYQAFQRVITTGHRQVIRTEENETKKTAETGPGSMLNIPGDNVGVHVIEPSDPTGLINIVKEIRQEISAHGRIPQIALSVADGAGAASSLSLRIHYQPLDEKCNEKATLAGSGLEDVNRIILAYHKVLNNEDFTELESSVKFSKSLPADKAEDSTIQDTQLRNKVLSRETAMQQNGIDDVEEEKARIEEDSQADMVNDYGARLTQEMAGVLGQGAGK
jgi:SPP1 family phage portal protein